MLSQDTLDMWQAAGCQIYLFGTGAYSKAVYTYLGKQGASVCGFVVTKPSSKRAATGEPIISIDEFASENRSPCRLILAIDCKYYNEVVPKLAFAVDMLYFLDEQFKRDLLETHGDMAEAKNPYDTGFYAENLQHQAADARHIVAAIISFVQPESVIDIGCGVGLIAKTFRDFGAREVFGVDGDYVDRQNLQLDAGHFIPHDLKEPFISGRRYDLALSLEVAEHLEERNAAQFVGTLCSLSDIVVFSAAVPHQGGIQHVNEKPQSYWAQLFDENGYAPIDCIRPQIWDNPEVSDFYKQNIILYMKRAEANRPAIGKYALQPLLNIIHPDMFGRIVGMLKDKYETRQEA
jgi:2-polyprenyl-3-methyl-5-hydroxy-6-metoxy-1,4-benzoquinol methylase